MNCPGLACIFQQFITLACIVQNVQPLLQTDAVFTQVAQQLHCPGKTVLQQHRAAAHPAILLLPQLHYNALRSGGTAIYKGVGMLQPFQF